MIKIIKATVKPFLRILDRGYYVKEINEAVEEGDLGYLKKLLPLAEEVDIGIDTVKGLDINEDHVELNKFLESQGLKKTQKEGRKFW